MRIFALILSILWTQISVAEIRLVAEPSGKSAIYNYIPSNPASGMEIVGGLGGTDCGGGTGVCDNCTGAPWGTVCNEKRISPDTELVFIFSSTTVNSGIPRITAQLTAETQVTTTASISPVLINQQVTLKTTWRNLCNNFNANIADPNCDLRGTQTFKVGIDGGTPDGFLNGGSDDFITVTVEVVNPDTTTAPANFSTKFDSTNIGDCPATGGICDFSLSRGDEKATIENLVVGTGGLETTYKSVLFYCALSSDYNDIINPCASPVGISGSNVLLEDTITGLSNGTEYVFRAAIQDKAGNRGLFFQVDSAVCPAGTTDCHKVTPEEVVGLFRDTNCFVATAAFGSPMEKQVKTLRRFRDQVLSKTSFGKMFVNLYYQVSPPMARWIAQSPLRRSVARGALTPVIFSIALAMDHPFWFGLILLGLVSTIVLWLRRSRESLT
jgi:hypothetical protein